MNLQLVRDYAGADCTLGRLTINGLTLRTLERPWIADPPHACGHPGLSCVPSALYALALHDTPRFPRHFALVNEALGIYHEAVPPGQFGRAACLIHTGNWVTDVHGCIIVGRDRKIVNGRWMLLDSRDAFAAFQAVVPWQQGHSLSVEYAAGAVTSPIS